MFGGLEYLDNVEKLPEGLQGYAPTKIIRIHIKDIPKTCQSHPTDSPETYYRHPKDMPESFQRQRKEIPKIYPTHLKDINCVDTVKRL